MVDIDKKEILKSMDIKKRVSLISEFIDNAIKLKTSYLIDFKSSRSISP